MIVAPSFNLLNWDSARGKRGKYTLILFRSSERQSEESARDKVIGGKQKAQQVGESREEYREFVSEERCKKFCLSRTRRI